MVSFMRIVCGCIAKKDGKYLLVQESKKGAEGKFSIPSGKIDSGESLIEAAIRETREESGFVVDIKSITTIIHIPATRTGKNAIIFTFNSDIIGGDIITSEEHPVVNFFSFEEIKKMHVDGKLRSRSTFSSIKAAEDGVELPLSIIFTIE